MFGLTAVVYLDPAAAVVVVVLVEEASSLLGSNNQLCSRLCHFPINSKVGHNKISEWLIFTVICDRRLYVLRDP